MSQVHMYPNSKGETLSISVLTRTDVLFALMLAVLSTGLSYQFAAGNQLEQLPIILRQLNPDYLARDFFLSTTQSFGPRSYFVALLGFICQWVSIPAAYLGLTYLSDLVLALVTLWVAKSVLGSSQIGAALAAVLALGLASFHLGDATQIRYEVFQPASLSLPLALAAIGFGLQGKPILAAVLAAIASLPHPLYGAEGGGIALGLAFFALLLPDHKPLRVDAIKSLAWGRALVRTLLGACILGAALIIFWWLPFTEVVAEARLTPTQFFDILVQFRAPHHYLPSAFRVSDYVSAAAFLGMTGLCFVFWSRDGLTRPLVLLFLLAGVVLLCCVLGFVFSELWPQRAILTLQLFRLLSLLKWVGFLLQGEVLARLLLSPASVSSRPLAILSLASSGVAQPIVSALSLALERWHPWTWLRLPVWIGLAGSVLFALACNGLVGSLDETVYLVFALGLVAVLWFGNRMAWIGYSGVLLLLCLFLLANRGAQMGIEQPALAPVISFDDRRDFEAQVAKQVADNVSADSLLITPPHFGHLRAIGGRAVVVDFKSIPFQDQAMLEWFYRIEQVYGPVEGGGFRALQQMDTAYHGISDTHLLFLAEQYGADYALLYSDTETKLPVVFENTVYRLVKLKSL